MKTKQIILWIVGSLIGLIFVVFIAGYFLIRSSLPDMDGSISVKGISADIEITFDEKGIPQVWATNEKDAWFAVGWLHASDRLFQMELTRRVASGRLSELFGDLTLEIDRAQNKIGHKIMAEAALDNIAEPYRTYLETYTAGVNAWVGESAVLPFEFYLLGSDFEPWSIKDCLMIISFQTWFSDALQNNDEFLQQLHDQVGLDKVREIITSYPENYPKTVPRGHSSSNKMTQNEAYTEDWQQYFYQSLFCGNTLPFLLTDASNAWVISPAKSKSGKAILANDPHLEVSRLPQFWYFLAVHAGDDLNAMGITTPGIPFFAMGHNGQAAWGFTAAAIDVTDHYRERLNPDNPDEYLHGDLYVPFETRTELIKVKGRDRLDTLNVKISRHGPVIGESEDGKELYTLRWAGFDFSPAEALSAGFRLAKTKNFDQFRKNVTGLGALDANWMYADKDGNIGYQLGTPVPVREKYAACERLIGWDEAYDWRGYHQLDDTPYAFNPEQGWLASCNNKPDEKNLDYELYGNFADDRIRRINEILSQTDIFTVEDMKKYQLDLKSFTSLRWKEEAKQILSHMGEEEWVNRLESWKADAAINSPEAALVETWLVLLKKYTFSDDFSDLTKKFLHRITNRDRNFEYVYSENIAYWFDDTTTEDKVETREDIALKAMKDALEMTENKNWGDIQTLTMSHPMAAVPVISFFLSLKRGPFPRAGTTGSLNNSGAFWSEKDLFVSRGGPSYRFIIDFNNIDQAQMVLPAGQSGHPLSDHFFDFYDLWENGEYWTVPFNRNEVEKMVKSRLILKRVK